VNYRIISDYDLIDVHKWMDFVKNHNYGNVFQTPEMYRVYKSTKYYEPVIVVCVDEENEIIGLILSVIQREYKGILGKLSSRSIIWGAPLIKDNDIQIFNLLMKEYTRLIKRKAVYTQIRNLWNMDDFRIDFEKLGYKYEDHLNILIDLTKSEEILWKEVYPKRRNEIKKSVKQGVFTGIFNETSLVEKSYEILVEVYRRARLPLPGKEYFINAKNILGDIGFLKFVGAFYEKKLIGVMYILCYNERIYEWYIGSYAEYMNIHSNDLLIWDTFKWSKINQYKIYDFGGAGKPDKEYGVREYKKKFGGTIVNLGRYQKVHNRILMSISLVGFKLWRLIKF
jgi:serine/alanine adding enzyme